MMCAMSTTVDLFLLFSHIFPTSRIFSPIRIRTASFSVSRLFFSAHLVHVQLAEYIYIFLEVFPFV